LVNPLRVLLIEDSEDDAALLLRELRRGGYEVTALRVDTVDGVAAALAQGDWDVVIADYVMPKYSGLDALAQVKADGRDIPFIIVSGAMGEELAVSAMKAGAHDYLTKDKLTRLPLAVERELREAAGRRAYRHSQIALTESRQRFHAFMDNIPAAAWIKDEALRYVFANRVFAALAGRSGGEILGCDDYALWPRAVAERVRARDLETLAAGNRQEALERVFNAAGEERVSVVLKFPLTDAGGGRYVGGVALDVTERERAEAALREANRRLQVLSSRALEMQENERRHLAHELHDEIGQALTAVKIRLQALAIEGGATGLPRGVEESVEIVDRALQQVRNLSLDLRPSLLDDLGLPSALRSQLDRQASVAGIKARFRVRVPPQRLHPDLETACFRIFQEAMTNVVRHARAHSVDVELKADETDLTLSISDDGAGFDVGAARQRALHGASLGIIGMDERAMLAGGRLVLDSEAQRGTRLTAVLPLRYRGAE
jgi:two-component system, NarL family, sensor histidine kinase UhpB